MRSITFQVVHHKIRFKCHACNIKKYMAIPSEVRRRSIRCPNCGAITKGLMNRRKRPRDQQYGKCLLTTIGGKEIEIDLHDISQSGIGFDLPFKSARTLSLRQQFFLKCQWNPNLFGNNKYVIKSIKGRRVGAEKITISNF